MTGIFFIINIAASLFLCGLIWIIQLVHYPFFRFANPGNFKEAMDFHRARISWIVVPVMLAEIFTSGWLAFYADSWQSLHLTGFIIVLLIWLVSFFLQVPIHAKLSKNYNRNLIKKLVSTNLFRTLLWTAKAGLSVEILRRIFF